MMMEMMILMVTKLIILTVRINSPYEDNTTKNNEKMMTVMVTKTVMRQETLIWG